MVASVAFVGSASATTLTSPAGTTVGVGAKIKLSAETAIQQEGEGPKITCENSTIEGQVGQAGGASETVRIPVSTLFFSSCSAGITVTVLKPGSLEIHTDTASANGNGTVTWSGAELTILTHNALIGTIHCIYQTEGTRFGTLTGSKNREGKTATLNLETAELPAIETSPFCGESAVWTGSYIFETPDYLDVD